MWSGPLANTSTGPHTGGSSNPRWLKWGLLWTASATGGPELPTQLSLDGSPRLMAALFILSTTSSCSHSLLQEWLTYNPNTLFWEIGHLFPLRDPAQQPVFKKPHLHIYAIYAGHEEWKAGQIKEGKPNCTTFLLLLFKPLFFPSKNPSKTTVQDTEFNYPRKLPPTVALVINAWYHRRYPTAL